MKNTFSCFIFTRNAVCVYKQSQVSFGIQSFCGKREINLVRNFIFLLFFYSSSDTRKNVSPYSLEESLSISKNRLFLHYFGFWYVGLYHFRILGHVRFRASTMCHAVFAGPSLIRPHHHAFMRLPGSLRCCAPRFGGVGARGDYMSRVLHICNPSPQENYLDGLI